MQYQRPGEYQIKAKVWLYPGQAGWRFVNVPRAYSDEIREVFGETARGWGSLRVRVTLGATVWATSIFPDKKSGEYMLPLKAAVRDQEGIAEGDLIAFRLEILT